MPLPPPPPARSVFVLISGIYLFQLVTGYDNIYGVCLSPYETVVHYEGEDACGSVPVCDCRRLGPHHHPFPFLRPAPPHTVLKSTRKTLRTLCVCVPSVPAADVGAGARGPAARDLQHAGLRAHGLLPGAPGGHRAGAREILRSGSGETLSRGCEGAGVLLADWLRHGAGGAALLPTHPAHFAPLLPRTAHAAPTFTCPCQFTYLLLLMTVLAGLVFTATSFLLFFRWEQGLGAGPDGKGLEAGWEGLGTVKRACMRSVGKQSSSDPPIRKDARPPTHATNHNQPPTHAHAIVHVHLYDACSHVLPAAMRQCAIGFSGVIFGLIVVDNAQSASSHRSIFGLFTVPAAYYPW